MGQPASKEEQVVRTDYPEKIYVHYEEGDAEKHCTLKISLPEKWAVATIDQLCQHFIEHYNKSKNSTLEPQKFHLENKEGKILRGDKTIQDTITNRMDVYLKSGPTQYKFSKTEQDHMDKVKEKAEMEKQQLLKCKNYGCRSKYQEQENHDKACRHHAAPPTFHDTKKGWSCCESKMVYDWDDFEKIEPCQISRHSNASPKPPVDTASGDSPAAVATPAPQKVADPPAAPKSIADFNKENPNAVTSVSAVLNKKKSTKPKRTDGKAKCKNFGCNKEYFVDINNEKSCCHHQSGPVFHDSGKYWSCCPEKKKYDFEEFLKIAGCVVSAHSDE